MICDFDLNRF